MSINMRKIFLVACVIVSVATILIFHTFIVAAGLLAFVLICVIVMTVAKNLEFDPLEQDRMIDRIQQDRIRKAAEEKKAKEQPVLLYEEPGNGMHNQSDGKMSAEAICPHCGEFVGYGDRDFCPHCGKKIADKML